MFRLRRTHARLVTRMTAFQLRSSASSPLPPHRSSVVGAVSRLASRAAWPAVGLVTLLSKTKWLIGGLKLLKASTLISAGLSVGVYGMIFGIPYAAGLVGQLAIHESGHAAAMRAKGIPFSPMVFIPFVGAAVSMNRQAKHAYDEGIVAIAGPAAGLTAAVGISIAGIALDSQLLIQLADVGYMINLFNLLPIGFLDGGRIAGALSRYNLLAGLGIGGYLIFAGIIESPLFYLIMMFASITTLDRFFTAPRTEYFAISMRQKMALIGLTVATIAALLIGKAFNEQYRKSFAELRAERGDLPPSDLEELVRQENVQRRIERGLDFLRERNPFRSAVFVPSGGKMWLLGTEDDTSTFAARERLERILQNCARARFYAPDEAAQIEGLKEMDPRLLHHGLIWVEDESCLRGLMYEQNGYSTWRRN